MIYAFSIPEVIYAPAFSGGNPNCGTQWYKQLYFVLASSTGCVVPLLSSIAGI